LAIANFGHIGGFVGPYAVGYLNDRTGNLAAALELIAASYLLAGSIVPPVKIQSPTLINAGRRVPQASVFASR
jgi:nitrate/nitrite transporter NarK